MRTLRETSEIVAVHLNAARVYDQQMPTEEGASSGAVGSAEAVEKLYAERRKQIAEFAQARGLDPEFVEVLESCRALQIGGLSLALEADRRLERVARIMARLEELEGVQETHEERRALFDELEELDTRKDLERGCRALKRFERVALPLIRRMVQPRSTNHKRFQRSRGRRVARRVATDSGGDGGEDGPPGGQEEPPGRLVPVDADASRGSSITPAKNQRCRASTENGTGSGSKGSTPSQGPPKTSSATGQDGQETRCVGRRVDALVLGFNVELSDDIGRRLTESMNSALTQGRAALEIGEFAFCLKRSRKGDFFPFENADVRAVFDCLAQGGWTLEVVLRAEFLATHALRESIRLAERIAESFGKVHGSRVRRVDACADFVHFNLRPSDVERLCTTRARTSSFLVNSKDLEEAGDFIDQETLRVFRDSARRVTGISIASGNPLSARCYDKTTELALAGRGHKREFEEARWREHGWCGEAVTRFELQVRGEALDELDLRDADKLEQRIDGLWQYGTRWVRLVEPNSASRRSRCANDPRWDVVSAVVFAHEAAPAERRRSRGGTPPEQVIGAVRSHLASTGAISSIGEHVSEEGEVLSHAEYAARLSPEEARERVGKYLRWLFGKAAAELIAALSLDRSWNQLLTRLLVRHDAACARWTSIDDGSPCRFPEEES